MNTDPVTLPWRRPLTYMAEFLNLMERRSIPSWINFHLSLRRIASIFLSVVDRSDLMEIGKEREWHFESIFLASAVEFSKTRIGRRLFMSYLPRWSQSFVHVISSKTIAVTNLTFTDRAFVKFRDKRAYIVVVFVASGVWDEWAFRQFGNTKDNNIEFPVTGDSSW